MLILSFLVWKRLNLTLKTFPRDFYHQIKEILYLFVGNHGSSPYLTVVLMFTEIGADYGV